MKLDLNNRFNRVRSKLLPLPRPKPLSSGWKGAITAVFACALLLILFQSYYMIGGQGPLRYVIGSVVAIVFFVLAAGVAALGLHLLKKLPTLYIWAVVASAGMMLFCFIVPTVSLILIAATITIVSLLGSMLWKWRKKEYTGIARRGIIFRVLWAGLLTVTLISGTFWYLGSGSDPLSPAYRLNEMKKAPRYSTQLPDPSKPGAYAVKTLTYGSPNNYREVFRQSGSLTTQPVDGSAFVSGWSSIRTGTLGFGPEKMPLNGLVWYPEGKGPFPVVMAVHGNHTMTDYSDPGYEYLGKLLASRGYIFISIDENFLNTSPYDDMFIFQVPVKENPARAWLMLEHLKVWKQWNEDRSNPFYGRADLNNVALIGHSRGGEAITLAALFNGQKAYSENALIKFNYNFGIRSLIAIGGTDGQFKPSGTTVNLHNINYLTLQGVHDMDVSSYDTTNQYKRITFDPGTAWMKSAVYIYGANHGQFNSVWGRTDGAGLANRLYNTKQLMSEDMQQQTAKGFISAFLETTLKQNNSYRQVFQDLGYAKSWLPDNQYISNYMDAHTSLLAGYNEDTDPSTATLAGGELIGEHLKEWKEETVQLKFAPSEYRAARIGWDQTASGGKPPVYSLRLPDEGVKPQKGSSLVFSIANLEDHPVNLTVQVTDRSGHEASLLLSELSPVVPMVEGRFLKAPFDLMSPVKEPVFQNYGMALDDFKQVNRDFDPTGLKEIRFKFDQSKKGTILMNDIGLRLK
ncbi:MFS transporter [Paenibacillus sp. J22TS3]|uniref:poly(ethylene terephthalate) hydrolase family protein n=1 Tax=Paenibacillus sp. J22TS3 TaxID=2807192 RepID=UPI001B187DA7|nr:MFS transporter [Paenibacillus sp. J22TS3]GIP21718.1 hypothetical protein J22TS3_19930 [Paenibacillus sp. J22TS3]